MEIVLKKSQPTYRTTQSIIQRVIGQNTDQQL